MEFPVSRSYVLARAVALWVTLIAFLASAALMASLAPPSLLRFATLTSLCLACLLACLQLFRCTRRIRRTDVRIVLDDDSISLPRLMCGSSKRYRMEDVSASTLHRSMNGEEWLIISTRIGLFIVERRLFQSNHSFDRFCAALNREGNNPVKRPHAMRFPILSLLLAAVFLILYYLTPILSAQDTTVALPIGSGALDIDDVGRQISGKGYGRVTDANCCRGSRGRQPSIRAITDTKELPKSHSTFGDNRIEVQNAIMQYGT